MFHGIWSAGGKTLTIVLQSLMVLGKMLIWSFNYLSSESPLQRLPLASPIPLRLKMVLYFSWRCIFSSSCIQYIILVLLSLLPTNKTQTEVTWKCFSVPLYIYDMIYDMTWHIKIYNRKTAHWLTQCLWQPLSRLRSTLAWESQNPAFCLDQKIGSLCLLPWPTGMKCVSSQPCSELLMF